MKVKIDVKDISSKEYLLQDGKYTVVIPKKLCEIIDEEQKEEPFLTEKQAGRLITILWQLFDEEHTWTKNEIIDSLIKDGWNIKKEKSKKQDFEDALFHYKQQFSLTSEFDDLIDKVLAAIEEAENKQCR